MPIANMSSEMLKSRPLGLVSGIGLSALAIIFAPSTFAQEPGQENFASAEQATNALFVAAQHNDEQAIIKILGGGKDSVSSGDEIEDKHELEQFAQKYQEMHRLGRNSDGNTVLYVGAENWPFLAPLVLKHGRWYFDSNTGAQEILYRRIGENELTAIETCRALVFAAERHESGEIDNDPIRQFARSFVRANLEAGGVAQAHAEGVFAPFYGYVFKKLLDQQYGLAFLAYPSQYRSSGVMTFVVAQDDIVYQKDLGPNTARVAEVLVAWKPDSSWHIAD